MIFDRGVVPGDMLKLAQSNYVIAGCQHLPPEGMENERADGDMGWVARLGGNDAEPLLVIATKEFDRCSYLLVLAPNQRLCWVKDMFLAPVGKG